MTFNMLPSDVESGKDQKSKVQRQVVTTRWQAFVGVLLVALVVRSVYIWPLLNYYKPMSPIAWNHPRGLMAYVVEPCNLIHSAPKYCFENSSDEAQIYQPCLSLASAYINGLFQSPSIVEAGSFHSVEECRFYDVDGHIIKQPKPIDLPYFGMSVVMDCNYYSKNGGATVSYACGDNSSLVFQRFDRGVYGNVRSSDVPVEVVGGGGMASINGAECYWTDTDTTLDDSAFAIYTGRTHKALIWGDECIHDPHSVIYDLNGKITTPPKSYGQPFYSMQPHLTLLYDKTSGKLAGGYWWGVFHQVD